MTKRAAPGGRPARPGSVAGSPVLEVRNVARRFGTTVALDGVTLALGPGEIYALLGPNGAGKTTLIRSICGRLRLDDGTVRVGGADPRRDTGIRRRLGLVPQEIALYPYLTVSENLEVLGRLAGVAREAIGAAVVRALEWTGLAERAQDRSDELSGGMRRRLNIAAGTLHRPSVLLLDEPTVGVDPTARERIHELLRRLRDEGMGVLLTTHDMEQAEELADRVGVLLDGRLRAEGSPRELIRESFGDAKQLTVTLASEPDAAGRTALRDAGLEATADPCTWAARWRGGLDGLSELGGRLNAAGHATTEIRVREPGLREVFFSVTGREFEP